MFNLKEFITKNIVNGVKNGTFAKEYGNIMAVNYLTKGILNEEDVANIDTQLTAWEESQSKPEESEPEELLKEVTEEITEPTAEELEDLNEEVAQEELAEQSDEELPEEPTEP